MSNEETLPDLVDVKEETEDEEKRSDECPCCSSDEWFGGSDRRMCIEELKFDQIHGWRGFLAVESDSEPTENILKRLANRINEKVREHEAKEKKKFKVSGADCIDMTNGGIWLNIAQSDVNVDKLGYEPEISIGDYSDYPIGTYDIESISVNVVTERKGADLLLCKIVVHHAYHHTS